MRKPVFGGLTRSDTNRAAQPQKIARDLKFRIKEEEVLLYPCTENKGADKVCGYRTADLRLCFRICKKQIFAIRGSFSQTVSLQSVCPILAYSSLFGNAY